MDVVRIRSTVYMPQVFVAGALATRRTDKGIKNDISAKKYLGDDATRAEGDTDFRSWRVENG